MSDQNTTDEWVAPCRDTAGRIRSTRIVVTKQGVTVINPPGESATYTVGQFRHFQRMLGKAGDVFAGGDSNRASEHAGTCDV